MIRATVGIWMNYATTLVFQILFAARFGSGVAANVFVITFGFLIALAAVITVTIQSVAVPRLVGPDGRLARGALRVMTVFTACAAVTLIAIAVSPSASARPLAHHMHLTTAELAQPIRIACFFAFLQVLAGNLIVIAIARGRRFIPAVAPALPSIAACVLLVLQHPVSIASLFGALAAGSGLELMILGLGFGRPGISRIPQGGIGLVALATATQLSLLALVAPVERVLASVYSPMGAAHYNYAIRSLTIVAQLLIGGVVLSALGDWSNVTQGYASTSTKVRQSLGRVAIWCGVLFVFVASLALVAGHRVVALVYQHGSFSPADTRVVTHLLLLALPGFCAEGVVLVLSQGLLAFRKNWAAIMIGLVYGPVRLVLAFILAAHTGVEGVAIGYSISTVAILVVQVAIVARLSLVGRESVAALRAGALISFGTIGGAMICVAFGGLVPLFAQPVAVIAVFLALLAVSRPQLGLGA